MLRVLLIKALIEPIWARRRLWLLYLILIGLSQLILDQAPAIHYLFMLFAIGTFTIPHGTADLFLPAWILNPPWEKQINYWIPAMAIVIFVAGGTWLIFEFSIDFGVALFSALVMWHWGSVDAVSIYPQRALAWVIASIGRGMLIVSAPMYFRPLEVQDFILNLTGAEESAILNTLYWLSEYILISGIALELLATAVNKFIEGRGFLKRAAGHLAETVFLVLMFKWANLQLSVTFYFLVLHSIRHMSRVSAYIPEARNQLLDVGGLFRNLPDYFHKTNFLNIVFIGLLVAWFMWNIITGSTLMEATFATLGPLLLLMIPHALVGLLADLNPRQL